MSSRCCWRTSPGWASLSGDAGGSSEYGTYGSFGGGEGVDDEAAGDGSSALVSTREGNLQDYNKPNFHYNCAIDSQAADIDVRFDESFAITAQHAPHPLKLISQ